MLKSSNLLVKRVVELDGIRGIAVILVLIWHYFANQAFLAQGGWLLHFTKLAWSGVDLFFVLSGFLIIGILIDEKGKAGYFKSFYLRRLTRILPLYYLLLLTFFLYSLIYYDGGLSPWNSWERSLIHITLMQTWMAFGVPGAAQVATDPGAASWLGVVWTLSVEEHFYVLMPLLVARLSKRHLIVVLLILVVQAPFLRAFWEAGSKGFFLARADSLALGGLVALLIRNPVALKALQQKGKQLGTALVILLIGTALLNFVQSNQGDVLVHSWLSLLFGLLILFVFTHPERRAIRFFKNPFLVWFGLRCYAIYLFHQPVSLLLHNQWHSGVPRFTSFSGMLPTAVALALTLVLAEISFQLYEKHWIRWGRAWARDARIKAQIKR